MFAVGGLLNCRRSSYHLFRQTSNNHSVKSILYFHIRVKDEQMDHTKLAAEMSFLNPYYNMECDGEKTATEMKTDSVSGEKFASCICCF